MAIDYIPFANFVDTGITSTESFDVWRQKINGVIVQILDQYQKNEIDAAFVKLNPTSLQTITGDLYVSGSFKFDKLVSLADGIFFPVDSSIINATTTPRLFSSSINIAGVHTGPALVLGNSAGVNPSIALHAGKGVFQQLVVTGPTITLNGLTYTVPTSSSDDAILTISTGNVLSWSPKQGFIDSITSGAQTYLSTDINTPVGAVVPFLGAPGVIPSGWIQDNQSVSAALYPQLAAVLGSSGGFINIPNYAALHGAENGFIYIVKAKSNDVSAFNIVGGDGIQLYNTANTPISSLNMTATGGKIGIKVSSQFGFDVSGALKLAANSVTSTEIANGVITPAKLSAGAPTWDTAGNLTVSGKVKAEDPTLDNHAVTKGYLDASLNKLYGRVQKFLANGSDGTTPTYSDRDFAWVDTDNNIFGIAIDNNSSKWGNGIPQQMTQIRVNEEVPLSADIYICVDHMHVLQNGKIYARGYNAYGQLGLTTYNAGANVTQWTRCFDTSKTYKKVVYAGGGSVSDLLNTGALATDGTVHIAGQNTYGVLGSSGGTSNFRVTGLPTADDFLLIGGYWSGQTDNITTAAVLGIDGTVWTWGYGDQGQMGRGTSVASNPAPAQITYPVGMGSVAKLRGGGSGVSGRIGTRFGIIDNAGSLWNWGANPLGCLGVGDNLERTIPTLSWNAAIKGPVSEVAFSSSAYHPSSLLITANDRKLYTCGYNYNGQLGVNVAINTEVRSWTAVRPTWETDGFPYVQKVWTPNTKTPHNETTTFVLANSNLDGSGEAALYVYGYNVHHRAGTGDVLNAVITTPKRVPFDANDIADISGNYVYTVIRKNDGRAFYAGYRYYFTASEEWNGATTDYFTPIPQTGSY